MNNPSKIYASSHVHHKAYQKPQNSQPDLNQNLDSEILSHSRVGPMSVPQAPKIHRLHFPPHFNTLKFISRYAITHPRVNPRTFTNTRLLVFTFTFMLSHPESCLPFYPTTFFCARN